MLERMEGLPEGIEGVKAVGRVTKADYDRVFSPLLDEARRGGRRLRLLYHLGPELEGFSPGGAWEDARLGLGATRLFAGCAVVSDIGWVREISRVIGSLMPCPVRIFADQEETEAAEWLASLPGGAGISMQPVPERGVIVVDVSRPLGSQDFDALALAAGAWEETHRELRGLVIHARRFPGWQDIGSVIRHVQFIRDHHRKVHRVALAADSKLAGVVPRIADYFVDSELKGFAYDQVDAAVAWAGALEDESGSRAPARSA